MYELTIKLSKVFIIIFLLNIFIYWLNVLTENIHSFYILISTVLTFISFILSLKTWSWLNEQKE